MKGDMMILTPVFLLICWMLPAVSTGETAETGLNGFIQLDMAPDSVDDMYHGCKEQMKSKVLKEFLMNEKNEDDNFKKAWEKAGGQPSAKIGKEQGMAIYVYTLDKPNVEVDFNNAVHTQKSQYKTTFKYHALHFLLTDALQTLNARKDAKRCLTGYHRNNRYFSQDVLNKEIRFGFFTSTSQVDYLPPKYGDKSCFEIYTCYGEDISLFSKFSEAEREVLIPPYEVFKVTEIKRRPEQMDLPCDVVYKVKSTGKILSNTNCALFLETDSQI